MTPKPADGFVVVTGMHRSGTTLLGDLINTYPSCHVVHEPLNADFGLRNVRHVYPSDFCEKQFDTYNARLLSLLEGKERFVTDVPTDYFFKSILRKISGGRTGIDIKKLQVKRVLRRRITPVFKDPFQALMLEGHLRQNRKAVAVIRHPAAVWLSVKRMGWEFDFLNFACSRLVEYLLPGIKLKDLLSKPEIEKFSYLWLIINKYIFSLNLNPFLNIVIHENLCLSPFNELNKIEKFLLLDSNDVSKSFIKENFFSGEADVANDTLHVRQRDAATLATSWYDKISVEEELVIQNICGELVDQIYGGWRAF